MWWELVAIFIITFQMSDMFNFLGEILEGLKVKRVPIAVIKSIGVYLLVCRKCNSFWFSLILITGSGGGGLLGWASASIISLLIDFLKTIEWKKTTF
jgi:hypothetical protein